MSIDYLVASIFLITHNHDGQKFPLLLLCIFLAHINEFGWPNIH